MVDNSQKSEITRKRLLWRAMHRGIKEMDIVVGGFAQVRLSSMSTGELAQQLRRTGWEPAVGQNSKQALAGEGRELRRL